MDSKAYRGAILVLIGILVGVILLAVALDEPVGESVTTDTTQETDEEVDTENDEEGNDDEDTTSTTASFPVRDPSVTKVIVANGTDIDGAAGNLTDTLNVLNYNTLTAANTSGTQSESRIYFLPSWEPEARGLAEALGYTDITYIDQLVEKLPIPFGVAEIETATIVIVLGGPDEFAEQQRPPESEEDS